MQALYLLVNLKVKMLFKLQQISSGAGKGAAHPDPPRLNVTLNPLTHQVVMSPPPRGNPPPAHNKLTGSICPFPAAINPC